MKNNKSLHQAQHFGFSCHEQTYNKTSFLHINSRN